MWEVEIEEKYQSNIKYLSEGVYRVYLSGNHLGFIRLGSVESVCELPVSDVITHIYVQLCAPRPGGWRVVTIDLSTGDKHLIGVLLSNLFV